MLAAVQLESEVHLNGENVRVPAEELVSCWVVVVERYGVQDLQMRLAVKSSLELPACRRFSNCAFWWGSQSDGLRA